MLEDYFTDKRVVIVTSKERVRTAILHQQPDRVPTNFECVSSVMGNLLKRYDFDNEEQDLQKFGIDMRGVSPTYIGPELKTYHENGSLIEENFWGWKNKLHWTGMEYNSIVCYFPLNELDTVEQLENYRWPSPDWFDYESVKPSSWGMRVPSRSPPFFAVWINC